MAVIAEYVEKALCHATIEEMEDGRYFGSIPGLKGPWAEAESKETCLNELREVLEEWLVAALRDDDDLPEFDGASLNFGGKRWSESLRAESSSGS